MTSVGIAATAHYLPQRWMTAAEIGVVSGIPERVVVEKFGLRGKHVADENEHVSDMSAAAGNRALAAAGLGPSDVDAVVYYGSTWKDHPVWQAAPRIADLLGCRDAFALELDYVSCGTPVALRVVRDMLAAEPDLRRVLLLAACRESYLIDYEDPGSRFTYNFGDGAAAAVLERDLGRNEVLASHMITDGSLSRHVKVPAGGSVLPASVESVTTRQHLLHVEDPAGMKARLDPVSLPNFLRVAETACKRAGISLGDIAHLCGIHMKRSMHDELVATLGLLPDQASYLDDTGHMSGVDPMLALDRGITSGRIAAGDHVLTLAAGTGYTWAATVIHWGEGTTRG